MVIDLASVFAERFKDRPQILQAAVLGQSPVPNLNSYTALRALQLLKESEQVKMARAAQNPTESPSLVQSAMQMPQMLPQMPQRPPMPQQAPMAAASGGLASMPTPEEDYAEGGIVAFAGDSEEGQVTNSINPYEALQALVERYQQTGDPVLHQQAVQLQLSMIKDLASRQTKRPKELTPQEEAAKISDYVKARQQEAGPSPFGGLRQEIATARGERTKNLDQAQGMALLEASAAALQPGGTMRGLAGAAAAFGGSYGKALQADRAERRSLANMEMNLLDAERKERMGLYGEARTYRAAAAKEAKDAERAQFDRDANLIKLTGGVAKTLEPRRGAGAAKPPSLPQVDRRIAALQEEEIDRRSKDPNDPRIPVLKEKIKELTDMLISIRDLGPERLAAAAADRAVKIGAALKEAFKIYSVYDPEYLRANEAKKLEIEAKFREERRNFYRTNPEAIESDLAGLYSYPRTAPPPAPGAAPAARGATPPPPGGFVRDRAAP